MCVQAAVFFCAGLLAPAWPQEPPRLEAVAWRPFPGDVLLLAGEGRELVLLDSLLREKRRWRWQGGRVAVAAAWGGRWWLRPEGGAWGLLPEPPPPAGPLAAAGLQPPPWEGVVPPPAGRAAASCPGPGGQRLRLATDGRAVILEPAPWEHRGEIQWGPGWATLRIRSRRPLPPVAWRRADGPLEQAPLVVDPSDPVLRQAFFLPLRPGEMLELRPPRVQRRWPTPDPPAWLRLRVPAVAPGGGRPVTVLPWPAPAPPSGG